MGADIPFCIVGGGALVTGIGEELRAVDPMPQCYLAVACMGEGISTPWGYGKLDELHNNFEDAKPSDPRPEILLQAMREDCILAHTSCFFNIFEEIVPALRPRVGEIKRVMRENGALYAMMSGSGPSVFGIFPQGDGSARRAREALTALGIPAWVCEPVG